MKNMLKKEAGITLIELMVVLVLAAVVTAAIYAIFISQQKSYATQTKVSDMQQNARAALTLMERDLRMAGCGVGSGFTMQDFLGNNVTNAITIVDNATTPDQITVVYAAQRVSYVTSVNDTKVTLNNVTGFGTSNGTQYIAFETVNGVYTISNIDIVGKELTLTSAPPAYIATIANVDPDTGAAITGAWAYLVKAITYQVDQSIDPATGQPRYTLERVASDQIGTVPDVPDDLWDDVGNHITNLQIVWPFSGDSNLLQVTLTGQDTDAEGNTMTREHQAVINIRN